MRLEQELKIAKKLALSAGKSLRLFQHKDLQIGPSTRPSQMVTIADLIADDIIVSGLQYAFPHDAICSEQMPVSSGRFECDRLWLVDALDGNTDFVEHGKDYAVSIGLAIGGHAVLGVVYNPARNELFAGTVTQRTTLNGSPVNSRKGCITDDIRISMPRSEWASAKHALQSVLPAVSTAYELARVAAGMDDAFFSVAPSREWSTCAGVALVNASGGSAVLNNGNRIAYNNGDLTHQAGIVAGCVNFPESLHEPSGRAATITRLLIDAGTGHRPVCPAA
jgi:myo-inositol-1(or 4)-monophosphatase